MSSFVLIGGLLASPIIYQNTLGGAWSETKNNGKTISYSGNPSVLRFLGMNETLTIGQKTLTETVKSADATVVLGEKSLLVRAANAQSLEEIDALIEEVCGKIEATTPVQKDGLLQTRLTVDNPSCIGTKF